MLKQKLSFLETDVRRKVLPCLKRTLTLVDVEILSIEGALEYVATGKVRYNRIIIESSELGSPRSTLATNNGLLSLLFPYSPE